MSVVVVKGATVAVGGCGVRRNASRQELNICRREMMDSGVGEERLVVMLKDADVESGGYGVRRKIVS
ncbi:hypothetical protein GLAREA_00310 [Glarea lozoyensis ATCC 20868]|uniref:Uncharacterized protein n=1 Tax=Glarea lozoyensis (strain ATCC 20868 / MF5171) TaxID=1116229 RepID=S3CU05_GLAL2|nr:uncharacterized protein GLAREA_00310 [Glarea lozoyensis ATCC 20868]EPE29150.1 hypothetical protein GLAREA_00310 [Glarea lozoyensis ATCC 20868]